ncbi:3abe712a-8d1b-46f9-ae22-654e8f14aecf [Thermothielavioides terrestris]|uniref:3abe712a-8d1b-46f9-ae22-654e8f14aecf n=1 Tax=Thermothielavioides terrestris TaxID=2587410 RepID=A0A446BUR8_9PEZI|nr:3abe712a-8d1b-46f9-ae22-654e8f14aecf [Thermothielavioides terrestris]
MAPFGKKCRHGPNCWYLRIGICQYLHSDSDHAAVRRTRLDELHRGLSRHRQELVDVASLAPESEDNFVGIAQERELASFNKVCGGEIAVPGIPPRFTPPTGPLELPRDDHNGPLRRDFPRYTFQFEPLLRSVELMQPTFDMEAVDVISNAGNLSKLYEMLRNTSWQAMRFELELRGRTLLLSRWSDDPALAFRPGYGGGFERETCRHGAEEDPVLRHSASHHRVVAYRFGGLQYVVQSEVDAYSCNGDDHARPPPPPQSQTQSQPAAPARCGSKHNQARLRGRPPPRQKKRAASTHISGFAALTLDDPGDSKAFAAAATTTTTLPKKTATTPTLSKTPPPTTTTETRTTATSPTLLIHHAGRPIPPSWLVEIKTYNARTVGPRPLTALAQVYFARRAQLYEARHEGGVFLFRPRRGEAEAEGAAATGTGTGTGTGTVVRDVGGELCAWEHSEQPVLGKVAALVRAVRERVAEWRRGRGVVRAGMVCESDGTGAEGGVRVWLCEREGGAQGGDGLMPEDWGGSG